jgi:hypothetical protein
MPVKSDVVHERDQEADEVKWFTVGDAISKLTYLDEKEVMKKAKSIFNA